MFNWLYPIHCIYCGRPGEWSICPACMEGFPRLQPPVCLYCGEPVDGSQLDPYVCNACRDEPRTFSFARSLLARTPELLDILYRLKYAQEEYLADPLAMAMAELWEQTPELTEHDWALVPVPVTSRRLFRLGYNHAAALARGLSRYCRLPVVDALVRKHVSKHSQTRLSEGERYHNSLDSYAVAPRFSSGRKPLPPYLLLVDDVYTTGATTRACAKLLKDIPGVQEVGVVTLARAT